MGAGARACGAPGSVGRERVQLVMCSTGIRSWHRCIPARQTMIGAKQAERDREWNDWMDSFPSIKRQQRNVRGSVCLPLMQRGREADKRERGGRGRGLGHKHTQTHAHTQLPHQLPQHWRRNGEARARRGTARPCKAHQPLPPCSKTKRRDRGAARAGRGGREGGGEGGHCIINAYSCPLHSEFRADVFRAGV